MSLETVILNFLQVTIQEMATNDCVLLCLNRGKQNTARSSNQIKSLLLSHHHSTSALVSEILMSVLQTVQKNNRQFTYGQTVQKNNRQFTYGQTVQKTTTDNLHMDRQCKKKQQTIYIWTDSAKKQQTIYIWTDSAKNCTGAFTVLQTVQKNNSNLHMDRQCKKTTAIYIWTDSAKKQQQFTYGQTVQKKTTTTAIYIWTDSAKKTTAIYIWTVHIYRLYRRQCAKYTYMHSVRLVYYRDILNYQRHIIHRMGTSTLCTVSIHNVVYT